MKRVFGGGYLAFILVISGCGNGNSSFTQATSYELTVALSSASAGTVTSSPAGINCPGTCTTSFAQNTEVTLTAKPSSSYFFGGWSGACSGANSCSLKITSAETVTASFNAGETLTVSMTGSGTGTVTSTPAGINCPTTCTATFPQNTQVTLTETPGSNDVFASWGGACTGSASCTIMLSASDAVTASFTGNTVVGGNPTALVYVSGGNPAGIFAFSADSSGQLTTVSGSPFATNAGILTTNGKYLFGADATNIYSFSIASDGTISQVASINATQYNGNGQCGGGPFGLFTDRTGATLYDVDGNSCANNAYQSFSIDQSTGALTFLAITSDQSPVFTGALSFLANDLYGYGSNCYHFLPTIFGFTRNSDGTLALDGSLGLNPPIPAAPSGSSYCPYLAAADAANDVVIPLTPLNANSFQVTGQTQLSVYTADSQGNLTTTSTASNMPATAVSSTAPLGVTDISVSPSGAFVAVSGPLGLQVFQLNGANPLTQVTGLLVNNEIDQVGWDNSNHLYAIGASSGQLFVFTITATTVTQAPGSPYTIAQPNSLAVLPVS